MINRKLLYCSTGEYLLISLIMFPCLFILLPFIAILSPSSEDLRKVCKGRNDHLNRKWEWMDLTLGLMKSQSKRIWRAAERKERGIGVRGVQCRCSSVSQSWLNYHHHQSWKYQIYIQSYYTHSLFSCMNTIHFNWMTSMTLFRCILLIGPFYVCVSLVSLVCTIFPIPVWSLQCGTHLLLMLSSHAAVWNW